MKEMVSTASRTGRQLQHYIRGCRQVVGCIPYRIRTTTICEAMIEDIEVLLISSQKSTKLMFPKGGWETDESMEEAARRETLEEAGVYGVVGTKIGEWSFRSNSHDAYNDGHMFPLFVTEHLDEWPEQNARQRVWMSINEAKEVCVHSWMIEALDKFVDQLVSLRRKGEACCSVEVFRAEEAGSRGINVAQSGEEEVECCLVS